MLSDMIIKVSAKFITRISGPTGPWNSSPCGGLLAFLGNTFSPIRKDKFCPKPHNLQLDHPLTIRLSDPLNTPLKTPKFRPLIFVDGHTHTDTSFFYSWLIWTFVKDESKLTSAWADIILTSATCQCFNLSH